MFGKGGGSTTIQQDNEPPEWAKGLFTQSANVASDLYNSGTGFNIWPYSTVAAPSEMTQMGSQGLINTALSSDSYSLAQNPVNLTNQVMNQGGLMAPSQASMGFFGDMAGGQYNPSLDPFYTAMNAAYNPASMQATNIYGQAGSGQFNTNTGQRFGELGQQAMASTPADSLFANIIGGGINIGTGQDYRDIYNRAQAPGAATDYLTATARGDYLAEGNPYFRHILEQEAERLGDQIKGQFSAAGRYGSGANQDVLGERVGDFMLRGLSDDFTRERGLQMNAAQMIEAAQQGRLGQQLGAMHGLTGVESANIANQMGAGAQMNQDTMNRIAQALQAAQGQMGADSFNANAQLAGAQGLAGQGQNLFSNLFGGAQGLFGAQQQNLQNQVTGAQGAHNISNQGLGTALGYMGALPTVQANRTFAPNLLQQAGASEDQYNQSLVNDMVRRFYQQDMQPWTRLGALQAAAQGSAGSYGQTHQVTNQPSSFNPLGMLGSMAQLAMPFF